MAICGDTSSRRQRPPVIPSTCNTVSPDDFWWRHVLSWLAWANSACLVFHIGRVQACAYRAHDGESWSWGPLYWSLPWAFTSLRRGVSRPVRLVELPEGSWSSCLPRRVARWRIARPICLTGLLDWEFRAPPALAELLGVAWSVNPYKFLSS